MSLKNRGIDSRHLLEVARRGIGNREALAVVDCRMDLDFGLIIRDIY